VEELVALGYKLINLIEGFGDLLLLGLVQCDALVNNDVFGQAIGVC
jgi:hypothetical protein